eukprot:8446409-Pyramimonas_sp.AAC.3
MYCTTHPEDASGILHFKSGCEAYGRLDLTDKSPPDPVRAHSAMGALRREYDTRRNRPPSPVMEKGSLRR